MTPYKNLNGDSNVESYETIEDSIHILFRTGTHRNYLYDHIYTGKATVDRMKSLAAQGRGLSKYIAQTVKDRFCRKW
jgi:hypothetical protein